MEKPALSIRGLSRGPHLHPGTPLASSCLPPARSSPARQNQGARPADSCIFCPLSYTESVERKEDEWTGFDWRRW